MYPFRRTALPRLLVLFPILLLQGLALAQSTFIVRTTPTYTPSEDTLFLVGTFNNWNPGDAAFQLVPFRVDGEVAHYQLRCPQLPPHTEYKVTRGDWERVEGSTLGQSIDNRRYLPKGSSDTTWIDILSWEDLAEHIPARKKIKIKVTSLPTSTPIDASIYIAGSFNEWNPRDKKYKLQKEGEGSYTTWIPIREDTVEYKFTRGNWSSIEGARNGRARPNRLYLSNKEPQAQVEVKIETWEDLSGDPINTYTFLLLLAAFQGLLLIIAINTIQDNNVAANRILSLLILLISVALIGRVSTYGREIFQWQPKLLLLPDVIYFLYGPLFLWYIQTLLTIPSKSRWGKGIYFVPLVLHFMAYLPLLLMDTETFMSRVVDLSLKKYFILAAALALLFNTFYWWRCYQLIRNYEWSTNNNFSFEQNVQYFSTVIYLKLLCLLVWGLTYVIGFGGWWGEMDVVWLTDKLTDAVWVFLSLTVFFLGYFAMKQPEIFKLMEQEVVEEPPPPIADPTTSLTANPAMQSLKSRLEQLMAEEKPYLNPRLALSDLAEMVGTNIHTLSRLINEGFDKNFYDFINSYRVEAFKKRIVDPDYKNQTFLAIAFSVGFNSKTAFNRSFKKLTNSTPRKYVQAYEAQQELK